jgi:nucleotide-binding universal stress UspA family protein
VSTIAEHGLIPAVVCAVDDSAGAGAAIRVASSISKHADWRLVLVHVSPGYGLPAAEGSVSERQARAGGRQLLDRLVGDHQLSSVERRLEVGHPAELLPMIAAAENAVMIVVGSRERRGKLRSRLGRELAATAQCPVVVVPPVGG